ncbi:MAG: hypothetical protein OXC44_03515 [Proteobacteria bacterium]|nr:hypothetical protein [Pseudomonadota bacterium]
MIDPLTVLSTGEEIDNRLKRNTLFDQESRPEDTQENNNKEESTSDNSAGIDNNELNKQVTGTIYPTLNGQVVAIQREKILQSSGEEFTVIVLLVKNEDYLHTCVTTQVASSPYICTHAFRNKTYNPIYLRDIDTSPLNYEELSEFNTFGRKQYGKQSLTDFALAASGSGVMVFIAYQVLNKLMIIEKWKSGESFLLGALLFIVVDYIYSHFQKRHNAYRFPFKHSFRYKPNLTLSPNSYLANFTGALFQDNPESKAAILAPGMDMPGIQQKLGLFLNSSSRAKELHNISYYCTPQLSLNGTQISSYNIKCSGLYTIPKR